MYSKLSTAFASWRGWEGVGGANGDQERSGASWLPSAAVLAGSGRYRSSDTADSAEGSG